MKIWKILNIQEILSPECLHFGSAFFSGTPFGIAFIIKKEEKLFQFGAVQKVCLAINIHNNSY